MKTFPSTTRYVSKAYKIEDFEYVLSVLFDAEVDNHMDLIIRKTCAHQETCTILIKAREKLEK